MMTFSTNKNCPGGGTPEQQLMMEGFEQPTTFIAENHTTHPRSIASLLGHGQENAVPLRHLESLTGLDGRAVRLRIQQERLNGIPILSDNQTGYYLPASQEELEKCVRSMRHRSGEILRVAEAVEMAGVNIGGYNGKEK